jgi:23S rRNA (uracil1939-C5)-methyltransferase
MKPTPPPPAKVRIERIGADGDGVVRLPDSTPLYLPFTLPGEQVTACPQRPRGEGWQASADTCDAASPDRAEPPCRHFGACGGCVLQHWRDAPYRAWKAGLLEAALRGAGFVPAAPPGLVPGLPGERRRLDFAVRRLAGRVVLGLHAARAAEVVDLADCVVLHPQLMALIAPLRRLLFGLRTLRKQGSVVVNLLDSGPDLLLRTDAPPSPADRVTLAGFARGHGLPRISWASGNGEPETVCLLRPPVTALSGVSVRPPPGAFLQATEAGERAIIAAVLRGLPGRLTARSRIVELYAGCGTLTFALSAMARVTAWEGDAAAVAALRQAVNERGMVGRVEAAVRDLIRQPISAKELMGCAAVVLDPPAAGAAPQMPEIVAAKVPQVIYVSCNPATLGRDVRVLRAAGYVLVEATAIDQFLWSARVESVSVFRLA